MIVEGWFLYALLSAILWGFAYPISEHVIKGGVSPASLMFFYTLIATPIYGLVAYTQGDLGQSFKTAVQSKTIVWWLIAMIIAYMTANLMVFIAIESKNATLASLIEATYPLFTALFAYLLFKDTQFNLGTFIGGAMIILGAVTIYRYS